MANSKNIVYDNNNCYNCLYCGCLFINYIDNEQPRASHSGSFHRVFPSTSSGFQTNCFGGGDMFKKLAFVGFCLLLAQSAFAQDKASEIVFPKDYQTKFKNYLSLDRTQNDDQIMRLFINDVGLKGFRETGTFPDGSIIVGEVYKAKKDEDGEVIESGLGRRVRGELALIGVMQKQKGWGDKFAKDFKNGDWDFAAFKADGSVANKDLNQCRACHAPHSELQHVYSIEHIK